MKKKLFVILVAMFIVSGILSGLSMADSQDSALSLNQKVAQLDINQATLNDAIDTFGEPKSYIWGEKTLTKDNLPSYFIAVFSDLDIFFMDDHIMELRFYKPDYIFKDAISVGTALETVLGVLGEPVKTVTGQKNECVDGVLYKDIDGMSGVGYYAQQNENIRMFFLAGKVNALYLTSKWFYASIPKHKSVSEKQQNDTEKNIGINKYDDVRKADLSKIDFTNQGELIATLWFSQQTKWPDSVKNLKNKSPEKLLRAAMNPGLGVRALHRQGIIGKGVSVAIIDQPLHTDHPEFAGKIAAYQDMGCNTESSMHGPAVASLLAGKNTGTAPGVKIYYAAAPSWLGDAAYFAKALDWIIDKNRELPEKQKIRVVSVSSAPSGYGSPFTQNNQMWDESYERAEKEGILVLDCTSHRGIIGSCIYNLDNPDDLSKCQPVYSGYNMGNSFSGEKILAPTSPRTSAEEYVKGNFSYQYTGRGGLSWGIPYVAGVLAMGWQVCPKLTPAQIKDLLFKSAYITENNCKIINPKAFIGLVKEFKKKQK